MMLGVLLWVSMGLQAQESTLAPDSINLAVEELPAGLAVGQSFAVNVVSRIDTPAYGFGFQIQYDPAVLEVFPRPDASGNSVPFVLGTIFGLPQSVKNADESVPESTLRQIDVVYTLLPPAPAVTGEGILGSVVFTIVGEGNTEIRLVNPRLIAVVEGTAQDIPVSPGNETIGLDINQSGVQQSSGAATGSRANNADSSVEETNRPSLLLLVGGVVGVLFVILIVVWVIRRRQKA